MLKQPMSCSGRFVRPFLSALARYPGVEREIELVRATPVESRIAVEWAQELVVRWVSATQDPDLGLRAGLLACIGSGGLLDYALHTAQTLRESIELAQRYARIYSDALEIEVVNEQDRVSIRIGNQYPAPRALTDFVLATWYRNHLQPHLEQTTRLECCFSYLQPNSIGVHERVFAGARLSFGAEFDGFSIPHHALERQLASADASLHDVHCEQLELYDSTFAQQQSFAMRVRRVVAAELARGRPTSGIVARRLRMSRRTLVRRLTHEGTTFTQLLDDLRRDLAVHLVMRAGKLSLYDIAKSLGFGHVQAFHRSFKRWTGSTPCRYRESVEPRPAVA